MLTARIHNPSVSPSRGRRAVARPGWLVAVVWLLVVLPVATTTASELETDHYCISTSGTQADAMIGEVGRLLEQAYASFKEHFGAEPQLVDGEKLGVYFADRQQDFHREMAQNGLPHIEGGGYYAPGSKIAYAWRQPQEYDTRALIIHECAHQFHFLACCDNRNPGADWFVEGVAEYLSNHLWDGTTLTCAALPWVTPKDNRARALAAFESGTVTLAKMIADEAGGYPEWWAFYRYLMCGDDGRLRRTHDRLAKVVNRGAFNAQHFARLVGQPDRVQEAFLEWLRANQQPLLQVWGYWQQTGGATLTADCPRVGLSVTRDTVETLSATVQPPDGGAFKAGLVLAFQDDSNFVMAFLDSAANVLRVHKWHNRAWVIVGSWQLPAREPSAAVVLQATRDGAKTAMLVNGQEIVRVAVGDMPSRMGVVADTCKLRFTDVKWGAADLEDDGNSEDGDSEDGDSEDDNSGE